MPEFSVQCTHHWLICVHSYFALFSTELRFCSQTTRCFDILAVSKSLHWTSQHMLCSLSQLFFLANNLQWNSTFFPTVQTVGVEGLSELHPPNSSTAQEHMQEVLNTVTPLNVPNGTMLAIQSFRFHKALKWESNTFKCQPCILVVDWYGLFSGWCRCRSL